MCKNCNLGILNKFNAQNLYRNETFSGSLVKEGVIDCFPREKKFYIKQKLIHCELSASAYGDKNLYLANDKNINDNNENKKLSSVFTFSPLANDKENIINLFLKWKNIQKKYLLAPFFREGSKWEDFAYDSFHHAFWGITAFNRYKEKDSSEDSYNFLLRWKAKNENKPQIANFKKRNGRNSSLALRAILKKALRSKLYPEGPPFFKIEGLAAISEKELLIGVRSLGNSYKDYSYKVILLKVFYSLTGKELNILPNNISVFDYTVIANTISKRVGGLSSLEYDRFHKRLYMLTSFEPKNQAKSLGGMMWQVKGILENRKLNLLPFLNEKNKILYFSHKPESVSVLAKDYLLVVHDDDRVLTWYQDSIKGKRKRQSNEAVYNIIKIGK